LGWGFFWVIAESHSDRDLHAIQAPEEPSRPSRPSPLHTRSGRHFLIEPPLAGIRESSEADSDVEESQPSIRYTKDPIKSPAPEPDIVCEGPGGSPTLYRFLDRAPIYTPIILSGFTNKNTIPLLQNQLEGTIQRS
jgi:hypothetical protein